MIKFIKLLLATLLGRVTHGCVFISSAIPQVCVKTGWTPQRVFITMEDACGMSTCGVQQDWFCVKIVRDGFIIQCDINSSFRKISWIAIK
jgi:hypothetical protein